jgi:hypothetical protein
MGGRGRRPVRWRGAARCRCEARRRAARSASTRTPAGAARGARAGRRRRARSQPRRRPRRPVPSERQGGRATGLLVGRSGERHRAEVPWRRGRRNRWIRSPPAAEGGTPPRASSAPPRATRPVRAPGRRPFVRTALFRPRPVHGSPRREPGRPPARRRHAPPGARLRARERAAPRRAGSGRALDAGGRAAAPLLAEVGRKRGSARRRARTVPRTALASTGAATARTGPTPRRTGSCRSRRPAAARQPRVRGRLCSLWSPARSDNSAWPDSDGRSSAGRGRSRGAPGQRRRHR